MALAASIPTASHASEPIQQRSDAGSTPIETMMQEIEKRGAKAGVRRDQFWRDALAAIGSLKRERFVPEDQRVHAYEDHARPIGYDQTISDPYVVAVMTSLLKLGKSSHVLEIGTGSGYQAAVLSQLAEQVWTIEIVEPLAKRATALLAEQGFSNVHVRAGDGYDGWPESAPFDAIIVTAGAPRIPAPLIEQLKPGGRMIIPLGKGFWDEELVLLTKGKRGKLKRRSLGPVMFVDFTGKIRR